MRKKKDGNTHRSGAGLQNPASAVESILSRKKNFLNLVKKYNTPFYVYDQEGLDESINRFVASFKKYIPKFQPYYAVKLNHHPLIVRRAVERGMGLDVASVRELNIALNAKATKIVYYSPAKNEEDLKYVLKHANKVRVHIDSFNELRLLGKLASKLKIKMMLVFVSTFLLMDYGRNMAYRSNNSKDSGMRRVVISF